MNPLRYFWTPTSGVSIDDFVKKFKPSVLDQTDAPWIWVGRAVDSTDEQAVLDAMNEEASHTKTLGKGQVIVDKLTARIAEIEKDDKIPVRGKKGVKSKKQLREEAQAEATAELKKLSQDSGWTMGKWMTFPLSEHVDACWAKVARSVAYGPLRDAGVTTAKVSTSQPGAPTQVVIIYVDDIYDKDKAKKVLVSLLEDHGINPSAAKSDLYTVLGIDSKHPSGIRSSVWTPANIIDGGVAAVKELQAKYKAGSEKQWKERAEDKTPGKTQGQADKGGGKDAPIAIDDEDEPGEKGKDALKKGVSFSDKVEKVAAKRSSPPPSNGRPAKRVKSAAALYKENDIFAEDSDEE